MKSQELGRFLSVGAALLLFITDCQGSSDVFKSQIVSSVPSAGKKRKEKEISRSTNPCVPKSSSKSKKRKEEDSDDSAVTRNARLIQSDEVLLRAKKQKNKLELKCLDIELWNGRRLSNSRRKKYKTYHKTIYTYDVLHESPEEEVKCESYQKCLREDVKEFSTIIAPLIRQNTLLYFIASRTTNVHTKYKDLWGLQSWFDSADSPEDENSEYRNIVEGFKGYYPGIFKDLMAYVRKHKPMHTLKLDPLTVWRESLGDVHMRECLSLNYSMLAEQKKIKDFDKKYSSLAYAVSMIIMLPEVYEDFSSISEEFIANTYATEGASENSKKKDHRIAAAMHTIVQKHAAEDVDESAYEDLYNLLEKIYGEEKMKKFTILELYRNMYVSLANFYKKVAVVDENKHVLVGKCIITNQRYMKCEMSLGSSLETPDESKVKLAYSLVYNRWDIAPATKKHYHVYYIDSTVTQPKVLCMPVYKDASGREHYLHTLDGIISHIKELYKMETLLGDVHPYKMDKKTKKWSYIKKEERGRTIKDLEEYEVVFYHIEEDLKTTKFVFAELRPLTPHDYDSVCIPLLLSSLMRSAVELGPFIRMDEHSELDSIEFENKQPDVYAYDTKYIDAEYSAVYKYYSNLYILPEEEMKEGMDCYTMGCKIDDQDKNNITAEWYVRMPESVDEYTHCIPDEAFNEKENSKKLVRLIDVLESREHCQGSKLQGIWLHSDQEESEIVDQRQRIFNWLEKGQGKTSRITKSLENIKLEISKAEEKLEDLKKQREALENSNDDIKKIKMEKNIIGCKKFRAKSNIKKLYKAVYAKLSKKPNRQAEFIVFRNVDDRNSNLGLHNEILDAFISFYKRQKPWKGK